MSESGPHSVIRLCRLNVRITSESGGRAEISGRLKCVPEPDSRTAANDVRG